MPFVTAPDTQASQQQVHQVHHTSRPRSTTMTTLGNFGVNLPTSVRTLTMGRTTDHSWTGNSYLALADGIMGQLDTGLDEGTSLKDGHETRADLGFYSTSTLPLYSPVQQSPVNRAETHLPSYQLYASVPSTSRQQHACDYSGPRINSACSNIDPQLQTTTLGHHHPPPYAAYGTRAISLPSSVHNSPTSTPGHIYGSIMVSTRPPRPPQLPQSSMLFCPQIPAQRTSIHVREAESETESQKSTSDAGKNRAFLRKGRSGTVYTVCPKQLYRCLFDPKCKVTKQKACDMKDHYYSDHALFNCMQCDKCGNSYARPCTYKRHLKADKTCPKPRTLTAEQEDQGRLRKEIMEYFADMTNERLVRKGVNLMKKCNARMDMRKRKRRVGCYRKTDSDDADDHDEDPKGAEQLVADCARAGSQFTSVNAHPQPDFQQAQNQTYPFLESSQLFDFPANTVPDITPRNYNPTQIDSMFDLGSFEFEDDLSFNQM
ncbi:hypothetical protein EV426DRAFT_20409 [Tirmania nivea]|nr:hypothetical protein EV426DRAFT_20409 [Tirmania nivea]